jgi:hypothetical protein
MIFKTKPLSYAITVRQRPWIALQNPRHPEDANIRNYEQTRISRTELKNVNELIQH